MADIQISLRRLQESIRGLSDASALIAPTLSIVTSEANSDGGESAVLFETSPRAASNHGPISPLTSALQDATAREGHSAHNIAILSPSRSSLCARSCGSDGSGGGGGSGRCAPIQESFVSSIVGDLGDSAEAARQLEDLRTEKESLRVMKHQLAAVHQLRVDLQRKDSVIQSLQLKVQEGRTAKDRADRLETHCHHLEERCLYLESSNAEYTERLGALDRESRTKIDGLLRDVDDLGRRLCDVEVELKAERRRSETGAAAHERELAAAVADGADARGLVEDLKTSLKEATAQAKRRKERFSEMEELLTSQLDETRKRLARAEHRASAAVEARRLDSVAATEAAASLERHLKKALLRKRGEAETGIQGGDDDGGEKERDSTEAFVDLSGRWCGNEVLALTWVSVSKALEELDGARAGEAAVIWSLREARRQVSERQEDVGVLRAELADLRAELSRLHHVEERLKSTSAGVEAARESVRKRDRLADAVWTQLSFLGFVSLRSQSPPGTPLGSPLGRNEGSCLSNTRAAGISGECVAGDLGFDLKEAEIMGGLKWIAAELSRLHHVEERLKSTCAGVEAARESVRKRDRLADAVWTQLSLLGFVSSRSRSPPGTPSGSPLGRNEGPCLSNTRAARTLEERVVGDLSLDSKEAEIMMGLKWLAAEWTERGKAVQTLSEQTRSERAHWEENKARLKTLAEAAKEEAGSKGAELARLALEFQNRVASLETKVSEKAAEAKDATDAAAEAVRRLPRAQEEADRRVSEVAKAKDATVDEAVRRLAQAQEEADRRASEVADGARRKEVAANEAVRRLAEAQEEADRRVSEVVEAKDVAANEAVRRLAQAQEEADRRVSEVVEAKDAAVDEAVRRLAQAREEADRRVSEVADGARRKEAAACLEANRRVSAAEEALAKAEDTARTAEAEAMVAWEGRQAVEAALRVLGRFVGPLRRLCLELREQKRFLARSYRLHAPLQVELFTVAAAVSGKDYWCLWRACCHSSDGRCYGQSGRRWVACSAACSSSSIVNFSRDGRTQQAEVPAPLPDLPPSFRAVVIAVIAANRLARMARGGGFPGGVADGAGGGGRRGGRRAEAVEAPGAASDARYVSNAAGARALPVLPAWCAAQDLEMPRADELEAMPDARALEVVLERLLIFDAEGEGVATGSAPSLRGSAPWTRRCGVLEAKASWGGCTGVEGGGGRDLLRHLLRGRKDHMMRVKERGLVLVDPRSLSGRNREGSVSLLRHPCRVRLGRRVREEMERSLWLGEGPGQPASLHLRDIRKALAALARELNTSEGKRLEFEGALRAAGGGIGIRELEKSAAALRRRVGLLEAEACARPDKAVVFALTKEKEKASAEAAALKDQVGALEAAVMTAKRAVQQASKESREVRLERDAAEERARKREARSRELLGEVDQLKEFARRASLERDECLERERATARDRGGVGNSSNSINNTIRAGRAPGGGVEVMEQQQQEQDLTAHAEELLRCSRKEEERLRSRCSQLEARVAESRSFLEKQRSVLESLRGEAARAHEEAEWAKQQAQNATEQSSQRESDHRRQLSVLEARLLEAGVKSTRRRDLLQLQASAQNDLRQALIDAMPAGAAAVTSDGLEHEIGVVSNASPARRNDDPCLL